VISWAIGNAIVRKGPSENILLDKGRSKERIDPLAAVVNAMTQIVTIPEVTGTGRVFFV
jgi:phage terminase large subunit-like protein